MTENWNYLNHLFDTFFSEPWSRYVELEPFVSLCIKRFRARLTAVRVVALFKRVKKIQSFFLGGGVGRMN